MDYVFLIASAAIILTCFYFVITPFFNTNGEVAVGAGEGNGSLSLEEIYTAVNELEMDYLMKKVNEEDFHKLKDRYQLLAAELMKQETKETKPKEKVVQKANVEEAEHEILEELQKLRKQKGK